LLGDPELLLLDEPANGLDPKGIRWLRKFLRSLAHDHGKTVFVSSHVLAEVAQMVDDVVIIDRGKLVAQGPVDTVVSHMGRSVVVRSPDIDSFVNLLSERKATVSRLDGDRLLVSGLDIEAIGQAAADNRLILFELREQGMSLEDTFLALTTSEERS
ncbi:MAG: ABC transporter ATP-binding protein, partial [Acidimicrobiia bacterium]